MDLFTILFVYLSIATIVFFIVFFSFIYYWHLKKTSFVIVPALFTFDFFLIGFLVISIIYLVIKYAPMFINILTT